MPPETSLPPHLSPSRRLLVVVFAILATLIASSLLFLLLPRPTNDTSPGKRSQNPHLPPSTSINNWQTYNSSIGNFSLKYPPGWQVTHHLNSINKFDPCPPLTTIKVLISPKDGSGGLHLEGVKYHPCIADAFYQESGMPIFSDTLRHPQKVEFNKTLSIQGIQGQQAVTNMHPGVAAFQTLFTNLRDREIDTLLISFNYELNNNIFLETNDNFDHSCSEVEQNPLLGYFCDNGKLNNKAEILARQNLYDQILSTLTFNENASPITISPLDTKHWSTYADPNVGISFKHPSHYFVFTQIPKSLLVPHVVVSSPPYTTPTTLTSCELHTHTPPCLVPGYNGEVPDFVQNLTLAGRPAQQFYYLDYHPVYQATLFENPAVELSIPIDGMGGKEIADTIISTLTFTSSPSATTTTHQDQDFQLSLEYNPSPFGIAKSYDATKLTLYQRDDFSHRVTFTKLTKPPSNHPNLDDWYESLSKPTTLYDDATTILTRTHTTLGDHPAIKLTTQFNQTATIYYLHRGDHLLRLETSDPEVPSLTQILSTFQILD